MSHSTAVDPLLSPTSPPSPQPRPFPSPLRSAARLLRRAGSRRVLRERSVLVRESAADQIEQRRSSWAYSKPIVVLDLVWNLIFVGVVIGVLVLSVDERPNVGLRVWVIGYGVQCGVHIGCVWSEYRRRRRRRWTGEGEGLALGRSVSEGEVIGDGENESVAKHLESANTMFSFIWWIIGFYWLSSGGQALEKEAPKLYWLCISFLAFDVCFVVICVAVACLIGIAVCCCLPCIIAILYAVADQEGATKCDIERLPRFKFSKLGDYEKKNGEIQESFGGIMTECDSDTLVEHVLSLEDAECCICLSSYDDGSELRELPCRHHFHCACIDKWLYINATCPLCKYNILKNGNSDTEDA
ncbi:hypothetical protein Droror1_Dr00011204 [Drosera rotundifolia]